jgi:pimeloyl-ACP methyl ester carboxylesterase
MSTAAFSPFRSTNARDEYLTLYAERARSWPVPAETKIIETPTGKTFVRLSGDPENPPLVLLPGSRDHSLTWIPNIAALSAHYRTCALDSIYDVGLSVSRRKLTKPEDLVTWLEEVLATLVPEGSFRLVGLSYGGWLASQYALRYPHRVQMLGLLTPAATVLPVSVPFLLRAVTSILPGTVFIKKFLYWLLQDTVQSGSEGRAIVDRAVEDWIAAKRCFGPLPLIGATVVKDHVLQAFQVPTLFLVGENEKVYSAQKAVERLNQVAPQIKTRIIPQAGHDLWIVQAERINKELLGFLGEPEG